MSTQKVTKLASRKKTTVDKLIKFEDNEENKLEDEIIVNNFVLIKKIGKGAFGQVFISWNFKDNIEVATKVETQKFSQIELEFIILKQLLINNSKLPVNHDFSGHYHIPQDRIMGFPKLYGYGKLTSGASYLVMECLGPNLMDLFNYCGKKFSLMTVCLIGMQIIGRIEYLHNKGFIHRDIKPENFLIGLGNESNIIYLIDYGLAKQFRDSKTKQHISYREGKNLKGTARYVSINTHLGIEQSRRDDLESIGYMLLYFLKGNLPWQGIKAANQQIEKIFEKKLQIPIELLCKDQAEEIYLYFKYVKGLNFEDKPDYKYLKQLFIKLLEKIMTKYKLQKKALRFDWVFDSHIQLEDFFFSEIKKTSLFRPEKAETSKFNQSNTPEQISVLKTDKNIQSTTKSNNDCLVTSPKRGDEIKIQMNEDDESDDLTVSINLGDNNSSNKIQIISESMYTDQEIEEIDEYINKKIKPQKEKPINDLETSKLSRLFKDTTESPFNNENTKHNFKNNTSNFTNDKDEQENVQFINDKSYQIMNDDDYHLLKNPDLNSEKMKKKPTVSFAVPINEALSINKRDKQTFQTSDIVGLKESNQNIINDSNRDIYGDIKFNTLTVGKKAIKLFSEKEKNKDLTYDEYKLSRKDLIKVVKDNVYEYYDKEKPNSRISYGQLVKSKKFNEIRVLKSYPKKSYRLEPILLHSNLSHPGVLHVFEIYEDNNNYNVIMEYFDGEPILDAVSKLSKFDEKECVEIIYKLLLTLNYLHSLNIVHGCLKSNSIFLKESKNSFLIKIVSYEFISLDTSLYKQDQSEKILNFLGTEFYYSSPELYMGNFSLMTDIWSIGIILHILICGYPPFDKQDYKELINSFKPNNLTFNSTEWKSISQEGKQLLENMLSNSQNRRIRASDALNNVWFSEVKENEKERINTIVINETEIFKLIINGMLNFPNENKLKKSILYFISVKFSFTKYSDLFNSLYNLFDSRKNGIIEVKGLIDGFNAYSQDMIKQRTIEDLFVMLDLNGDEQVSYHELITAMINNELFLTPDLLSIVFNIIDKNKNGIISLEEIYLILEGDKEKWLKIVQEYNDNGEMNYNEFVYMMSGIRLK